MSAPVKSIDEIAPCPTPRRSFLILYVIYLVLVIARFPFIIASKRLILELVLICLNWWWPYKYHSFVSRAQGTRDLPTYNISYFKFISIVKIKDLKYIYIILPIIRVS